MNVANQFSSITTCTSLSQRPFKWEATWSN